MFEPRPFANRPSGQDALMDALQRRDMAAFELALDDPHVDPDFWYGKPYWTTCLQLAAKSEGCEPFVLALLRARAGSRMSRSSAPALRRSVDADADAAQGFVHEGAATDSESSGVVREGGSQGRLSTGSGGSHVSGSRPGAQGELPAVERALGTWLREETKQMRGEVRTLVERVELLTERVAAMERAQQRGNDLLAATHLLLRSPR